MLREVLDRLLIMLLLEILWGAWLGAC